MSESCLPPPGTTPGRGCLGRSADRARGSERPSHPHAQLRSPPPLSASASRESPDACPSCRQHPSPHRSRSLRSSFRFPPLGSCPVGPCLSQTQVLLHRRQTILAVHRLDPRKPCVQHL